MRISIIVAADENDGIGYQNQIPWYLPADLKNFKSLTMGHHLIMGRKTFESIGRPLPGRTMIILTRDRSYRAEGCLVAHAFTSALHLAESRGADEVFIGGGSLVYREALKIAHKLYLTRVHTVAATDIYFPTVNFQDWVQVSATHYAQDQAHAYAFTIYCYQRKNSRHSTTESFPC